MSTVDKEKLSYDRKKIRALADKMCRELFIRGHHVLRYDAPFSTYIKVDAGLCHSIRISNHKSEKEHLSYRYNIMIDCLDNDYVTKCNKGYLKYYARSKSLFKIIDLITQNKKNSITKFGELNYYSYVLNELQKNSWKSKTFWGKARTLKHVDRHKLIYKNEIWTRTVENKVRKLNKKKIRI